MPWWNRDARNSILTAMKELDKPSTWTEIHNKSGVGRGSMTTHLNDLIEEELVSVTIHKKTKLYTLLEEGEWEYNLNKVRGFLNNLDGTATTNLTAFEEKMLVSVAIDFPEDKKEWVTEYMNKALNNELNKKLIKNLMRLIISKFDKDYKGAITFLYNPEGFS
jgi:c-di-AMP phosphodiesterase-like protein